MNAAGEDEAGGLKQAVARKGSFIRTVQAVAWSFFGVRKSSDHQQDLQQLNPLHLVIAGVALAVLFVLLLLLVVHWVTRGVAA